MSNLAQSPSFTPSFRRPYLFEKKVPARTIIPCDAARLFRVTSGVVRTLTYLEDGTPVVFGLWGPGEVVGGMLSHVSPYYIESFTAVEGTLFIPNDTTADSGCAAIVNLTKLYLQQVEELMVIRSHKTIDIRLIRLLSWISRRFGENNVQGNLINLRLTHQDLAELLGTTRVTVTRTLGQIEGQGLIKRLPLGRIILKEADIWCYQI
jgi:CRP-like cAMP-binding protein